MKLKAVSGMMLTLLLMGMLTLAFNIQPVKVIPLPSVPTVNVDPPTVTVNETFTININVTNVANLYSWQAKLYFDPAVLRCTNASLPSNHVFSGKPFIGLLQVITESYVTVGACLLGTPPAFNGSGILCQIAFDGLTIGSSKLNITNVHTFLLDDEVNDIPCEKKNGYATVVVPCTYELTVTSLPMTGVEFTVNGSSQTTPYTERLLGGCYILEMPETHDGCVWSHWLEDGDTNRTKTVTMYTDVSLTACMYAQHDLAVSLRASPCILLGRLTLLSATVCNSGLSNETDVELQLLIDGSLVANVKVPELTSGSSHTLNYLWTPTVEGTYNVTAIAPPVPDEAVITNNVAKRDVPVVATITGTYIFVEPPVNTGVNFTVTAMVFNVTDLAAFQVALYYDATVINMTSASLPADHILAGEPGLDLGPVYYYSDPWGAGMVGFSPYWWTTPFNGTGKLAVFEFEMITAPPEGDSLSSQLIISGTVGGWVWETKLKNSTGGTISFVGLDGYFVYPSSLPGDLNSDGVVDIDDLVVAVLAFGGYPGHPRWSPIADLNKDGIVDIDDIVTIAVHFGDHL